MPPGLLSQYDEQQPGQPQPMQDQQQSDSAQQGNARQQQEPELEPNEQKAQQQESSLTNKDKVQLSPAQQAQFQAYSDNATIMIWNEKTQPAILQSLQSQKDPMADIAVTANIVNSKLQSAAEKHGEQLTEITLFLGAAHIVSELNVLAEAAGIFALSNAQRLESFRQTLQKYFTDGLNNGTIDPVKLQQEIEPLMSPEQRQAGMQAMKENGISQTAPPTKPGAWRPPPQQQPQQGTPQQGMQPPQGLLGGQ